MAEAEAGCAPTFMVKDHFRLGRNWLVVGILLEETFAQYHTRYIVTGEGMDTINCRTYTPLFNGKKRRLNPPDKMLR